MAELALIIAPSLLLAFVLNIDSWCINACNNSFSNLNPSRVFRRLSDSKDE